MSTVYAERRRAQAERHRRTHGIGPRVKPVHVVKTPSWLAIDGEGWGVDAQGRQCYKLMTAATDDGYEDALYCQPGQERLHTAEMLEWLCFLDFRHGRRQIALGRRILRPRLCGYGLGYDYAHILLDLSLEQLKELFHNQDPDAGWIAYQVSEEEPLFLLKLTAGRLQIKRKVRGMQQGYANLWDVFRYFQSSFLVAADRVMTVEERILIEAGKARRGASVNDLKQEADYAIAECRVLARLMGTLEEQTKALDLHPSSWYGPGSLATLALKKQGVNACFRSDEELEPGLVSAAAKAFVGGRFETTGHGRLPHLFEYDIRSAYPYAITRLPCLQHTRWKHVTEPTLAQCDAEWALVHVEWKIPSPAGGWGPWPSRIQPKGDHYGQNQPAAGSLHEESQLQDQPDALHERLEGGGNGQVRSRLVGGGKDGRRRRDRSQKPERVDSSLPQAALDESKPHSYLPVWPWSGRAHIWGPEFRSGLDLLRRSTGWQVHIAEAWLPSIHCDCDPFGWVNQWYETRKELVAAGDPKEKWIKLIINSLYGKMAQQVGHPQWHSWLWSGMITAHTRSQLLSAIAQDPEAVVMTATDAVYSVKPLEMPVGDTLGAWEVKTLSDVLIVQSGFFKAHQTLSSDKPRTRGIPRRFIDWPRFEVVWDEIRHGLEQWDEAKIVIDSDPITGDRFQIHVGIGLAQLWGRVDRLGAWLDYPTEVTFSTDKRPLLWPEGPKRGDWLSTKPWMLPANEGSEYRAGRGIGEDHFLVMDQPDAAEWGEM